jgi:hypothetical protein
MKRNEQLARSGGYRVHTHDGRIGSVAAVLPRAGPGRNGVLLVSFGETYCTMSAVPFRDVEAVYVGERRVLLRRTREAMREAAPSGARDKVVSRV